MQGGDQVCGFLQVHPEVLLCYGLERALENSLWCSFIELWRLWRPSACPYSSSALGQASTSVTLASSPCQVVSIRVFVICILPLIIKTSSSWRCSFVSVMVCRRLFFRVVMDVLMAYKSTCGLSIFSVRSSWRTCVLWWQTPRCLPHNVSWSLLTRTRWRVLQPQSSLDVHPSWPSFLLEWCNCTTLAWKLYSLSGRTTVISICD
jgi:hypothetical protein